MFESCKTLPELADLPAVERKRARRGGFRYGQSPAVSAHGFVPVAVVAPGSVVMESFANKWAELGVFMSSVWIINVVLLRMLIHSVAPYWRQLRKARDNPTLHWTGPAERSS